MAEKQYKSFKEACLDILASHKEHPYTPRETAIYQTIYARPEGDFIRERFEKEYAEEILQKAKEIWPLGAKPMEFSPDENSDEDGLHWPTDKVFHRHVITNVHTDYYNGSRLGSPSALRMSVIYKLFRFLVNQGKLGNTQDNLMLFTFRLTGKNPYAIETNRKLVWLGPQSDYSLCYFVWRLFSEIVDVDGKERSKPIASKFRARTGDFFIYADGGVFDADDEQSRRQDFSKGRDLTDPFAKALRKELSVLIEEQASLESK